MFGAKQSAKLIIRRDAGIVTTVTEFYTDSLKIEKHGRCSICKAGRSTCCVCQRPLQ